MTGGAYSLPVKSDLFGEALLCKVADRIVVSIGEEVCQVVALPCIHLHSKPGSAVRVHAEALTVCANSWFSAGLLMFAQLCISGKGGLRPASVACGSL